MEKKYSYDEIFQRNIGLINSKNQEKIRNAKILIAGSGGIGGWTAELLVRFGVENIIIADPEEFEVSNLNRQGCSSSKTIGLNKSEVVGKFLSEINPNLKIEVVKCGINEKNVKELVSKTDLIIDTIDFYSIESEVLLHREARLQRKMVFVAQVAGSKATFTYFKPQDPELDDLLYKNGKYSMRKSISFFFPELPKEAGSFIMSRLFKGEEAVIPSVSVKPVMTASLMAEDVVRYITENKVNSYPSISIFDFDKRTYKIMTRKF